MRRAFEAAHVDRLLGELGLRAAQHVNKGCRGRVYCIVVCVCVREDDVECDFSILCLFSVRRRSCRVSFS